MAMTTSRRTASSVREDQRGFALQTVIVMTALIAIALAVSAVVLTRGGEVVDDLERQRITTTPDQINNRAHCEQVYQWEWDTDADGCKYPEPEPGNGNS